MADTIHKKRKDWPHFDKLHLGSKEYAEGWDRIFGKKKKNKAERRNEELPRKKMKASREDRNEL